MARDNHVALERLGDLPRSRSFQMIHTWLESGSSKRLPLKFVVIAKIKLQVAIVIAQFTAENGRRDLLPEMTAGPFANKQYGYESNEDQHGEEENLAALFYALRRSKPCVHQ